MNVGVSANVRSSDILFHYHLDLESFWNLLKFFVVKAQIREPTHISKLRAKTPESHMFLFFNYQVHSLEEKTGWCKGDSGCLGPAVPEAETHASKTGELGAFRTHFCAYRRGPRVSSLTLITSPVTPLPQVLHSGDTFTSFHTSTTCVGEESNIFLLEDSSHGVYIWAKFTPQCPTLFFSLLILMESVV